jgi:N-acetylneuraminic acid mutarotase
MWSEIEMSARDKEIEELKALAANAFDCKPQDIKEFHVSPSYQPCDHEWNNGGNDPTQCLKCGMSFTRYIFMECP